MNLFKKQAEPEPEIDGVTVLQLTLKNRNSKGNQNALYARDLNIAISKLNEFMAGHDCLNDDELQKLTKVLYPHSEFDVESRMLQNANKAPPTPVCTAMPEPYKNPNADVQAAHDAYLAALKAARPPEPVRPKPVTPLEPNWPMKRPGWK
jgi:hypothetical protein